MKTSLHPKKIQRTDTALTIEWSNGESYTLDALALRTNCPCAGCREKRGEDIHSKPLTGKKRSLAIIENTIEQETTLERIWSIGSYAIGIRWKDGHDSGIYTYELLRSLKTNQSPT
jgi:ATP-binding protein involved in chromosome partitioning